MPADDTGPEHAASNPNILQRSPIEISLVNRKVSSLHFAYLYISNAKQSDVDWGRFEIGIKNSGSDPIVVTQASTLQVHIPKELLTSADLNDIRLEEGSENIWSCSTTAKALVLKLKQERLEISSPGIKIFLGNVLASEKTALHRSVTFEWEKFAGIDDNSRSFTVYREFIAEKDTAAEIRCDSAPRSEYLNQGDCVYFTPRPTSAQYEGVKNRLILRISNQGPALEAESAEFVVSFPTQEYGDARTALCTTDQLKEVKCFPLEQSGWRGDEEKEGETKQWILRPPAGSKTILAKGQILQFEFRGIVTELQDGTSYALVNWRGINGKNPGYNILPIAKLPPIPFVKTMGVTYESQPLPVGEGVYYNETYAVNWESFAADFCELAEPKQELPPNHSINLTADKDQTFTVTPAVTLPGNFIRRGEPASSKVPLREALMGVEQRLQEGALTKIELKWRGRGGKVMLTAPVNRNQELPASGAELVTVSGLYQFECVGPKSKSTPVVVDLPHTNMTYDAQWSADNRQITFSWSARQANWLEVWVGYTDGREVKSNPGLQGSYTFDAGGMERCSIRASGAGECMFVWYSPPAGSKIPKITAAETKLPTGPNVRFAWNVQDAMGCMLWGGGSHEEDNIFDFRLQGEVERDLRNGLRGYMMFTMTLEKGMFIMAMVPTGIARPLISTKERADELDALATRHMKQNRLSTD